jgi:excisionase family DNA binding protein
MFHDAHEPNLERTLLIKQAAELLGVSRRTIYYRIREGRLRTIRTRCHSQRVLLSSIFELLREMRRAKETPRGHHRIVTVQDAGV